jgi:hypothetical protein
MVNAAKSTRQNRTLTVDFHDETTYFALLDNTKAFVEFVLAFILSIGFQLTHKSTCTGGGSLTRHSHYGVAGVSAGKFTMGLLSPRDFVKRLRVEMPVQVVLTTNDATRYYSY